MTADVVNLSYPAFMNNQIDCLAVILYIQPVTDIQTLSIYRKRLVSQGIGNHQRYQLLREMIGSVVVRAAADCNRKAVGAVVCLYQKICSCLGGAVGTAGVKRRLLCKEQIRAIQRKISVYLVCRNLVISLNSVFAAGIH